MVGLTATGQLNEIKLLALLGTGAVGWDEWVHECLKVGPPPLGQGICNLPLVVHTLTGELGANRGKSFVESLFESVNLVVFWP
jgi:hypothetical protein